MGKLTKEIREMLTKTIHTARKFPIPVITYLMVYSWSTPYSSDGCSQAYGFLRGGNLYQWSGISFLPTNTTRLRIEQIKACFPYDPPIFRLIISRLVLKCVSITEKFKLLIPLGTSEHNCGPNFSLFYGWHTAYNRSNHLIKAGDQDNASGLWNPTRGCIFLVFAQRYLFQSIQWIAQLV